MTVNKKENVTDVRILIIYLCLLTSKERSTARKSEKKRFCVFISLPINYYTYRVIHITLQP
jgi:hypothetical protein